MSTVNYPAQTKFLDDPYQHLSKVLSRPSIRASSFILLVKTWYDDINPSAFSVHFGLDACPLPMITGGTMDGQNGVLAFQSIIGDVTVPTISKIKLETLRRFVLDFFLFSVFDAKESEISSEDPLHFLVLEGFFLGAPEVFDVVVKVLIVGSDELDVFPLLS